MVLNVNKGEGNEQLFLPKLTDAYRNKTEGKELREKEEEKKRN